MTVPMDYIRVTRDQQLTNTKKRQGNSGKAPTMSMAAGSTSQQASSATALAGGKQAGMTTAATEFLFPEHLRMKESDTDKVKLQKRKKVKALKYQHKIQQQE